MAEWAGVTASTIAEYVRNETQAVLRNRILLAMLESKGLITYNHEGTEMDWPVRYREASAFGFDAGDTITFSRQNRHKRATLPWRGYAMGESMDEKTRLMNRGQAALVKLYSNMAKMMMSDMRSAFSGQLFIDGNAAGNGKLFHGFESFLGNTGLVDAANSKAGAPSSTYAGLSTALGNYQGSWSDTTVWPDGNGDANYDFWSPLIVDYQHAAWPQSTKTWDYTCEDALAYGIFHAQKNKDADATLDIVLLAKDLYLRFKNKLRLKENIQVTPREGSSGAYKLGFTNMQNFDGVDVTSDHDVPAGVGYGLCTNMIEICMLSDSIFETGGPVFNEETQAWRNWIAFYGNMRYKSVRNFVKWKAIS